ncbi:Protein DOA1 [Spathaspora sp. JA1]|nr:Protein DOA1 [Spathaspora sp. JA1]
MSYKLSATLTGHEQDVKSIATINESQLVSVSRDSTTRLWTDFSSSNQDSQIILHSPTASFINSVSYISDRGLIASGGQDGMIYLNESNGEGKEDLYQLIGHQGNVCALHYNHGQLISSSWDSTAKVWDLDDFKVKLDLKGHESSVWDCKVLANDQYLTCSADKTIRLWHGDHQIKQFKGHTDVVRKLLVLPGETQFLSSSNDCTIKLWDIATGQNLRTFIGHDSFIYDLALLGGQIVSTGEDRTVRIWNLTSGEPIQVITLPCISIWCVVSLSNGDFIVGSSDKLIRVFTKEESRFASADELAEFRKSVESQSIAEQSLDDLKKTDIPSYEALSKPGKNEGSVIMVKNDQGVIEAHQWSGGVWNKIGDVVGSAAQEKKEYNGVKYDYVFDVDIKEGEPALKLPYNANENPYIVAEKFLADNDLPSSYTEEVVRFIEQNTKGFKLEEAGSKQTENNNQEPQRVIDPYSDAYNRQTKLDNDLKVIPQNGFISYKDYKTDQLVNGLNKLNSNQDSSVQFNSDDIAAISECLSDLNSKNSLKLICQFGRHIIKKWNTSSKLIGFDLIRISVLRVTTVDLLNSTEASEILLDAIISGISDVSEESGNALLMMVVKVLNNIIATVFFVQLYIDPEGDHFQYNDFFKQFLKSLATIVGKISPDTKLYSTTMTTISTLIYNLTVNHLKTSGLKKNPNSSSIIVEFWNKVGTQIAESNSEAGYRLAIAYGNLKYAKAYSDSVPPSWLGEIGQLYAVEGGEQRFIELAQDFKKLV